MSATTPLHVQHFGAAAQLSGAELDAVVDLPLLLIVLDREMVIRWVSPATGRFLRRPTESLLGRSWYDFMPGARARRWQHERVLAGESLDLEGVSMSSQPGCERVIAVSLRPIRDAHGQVASVLALGRDVTDGNRVQSDWPKGLARLEAALAAAAVAIWTWDLGAEKLHVSDSWFQMTGLRPSSPEEVDRSWRDGVHPDDLATATGQYDTMRRGLTEAFQVEYRFRKASGDWVWLQDRARVQDRTADGRATHVIGTTLEITTQRKLGQFLAETQAAAGVGGWELDLQTGQLAWTRETYALFDTTPADYKPALDTAFSMYSQDSLPAVQAAVAAAREHGTPFDIQVQATTFKGRPIWLRLLGKADRVDGQTTRLYGAKQDITERRRAAAALQESESTLRALTDNAPDRLLLLDLDYRVRFANRTVRGIAPEALIGRHASEFVGAADQAALQQLCDRSVRERRMQRAESIETTPSGVPRFIEYYVAPVLDSASGKVTGLSVRVTDASDRRELERAIIAATSSEQQRIGRDLHDGLGQELTGVALLLRAFLNRPEKRTASEFKALKEIVSLVDHTVATARALAQGLSPASLKRGNLTDALRSLADSERHLHAVRVTVRARLEQPLQLPEQVINELHRIAQEAITNSVHHGCATAIRIQLSTRQSLVRLSVTDNGGGMPAPPPSDQGMGLRIMAYRARMLGGELRVESPRGGGVRVICICPLEASAGVRLVKQRRSTRP